MITLLLLMLTMVLSSLEAPCETFPCATIRTSTLVNHSYVDFNSVGERDNGLHCLTDLPTCCSNAQGDNRGDWFFPNQSRLQFNTETYERRGDKKVILHRKPNATPPSGVYRCDIHTNNTSESQTVFVGLYIHK
jgi:hypothetical protein